jgi:hypothetical protein
MSPGAVTATRLVPVESDAIDIHFWWLAEPEGV